ncbi:uncharacterized protein LOC117649546 [Thrips palmi]|uniref:Uncharacterized protein LOC117649546 n=1 Tax=Thrips palmi TaxID=161013 RepID=A0A6P8ZTI2_THRPL|nr:uncharacterized protein LOC117649546 [Thrips palmi]
MEPEEETEQTLNYDFNYNLVLCKSLMNKLSLPQERQLATDWLLKLSTCGTTMDEMRLRNMFAYLLLLSLQDGQLRPPFDSAAPAAPLPALEHLLPSVAYESGDDFGDASGLSGGYSHREQSYDDADGSGAGAGPTRRACDYSPDGGEFFASQPVPRCGAFCYLAVVARQDQ